MQKNDKIAAVVILYYPSREVIANIKTYYDLVEKLYVFDNTDKNSYIKNELLQLRKVAFYHDHHNEGIAKRLNKAAVLAIHDGFSWLLTMDQDTSFSQNAIETYLNCFGGYAGKERAAMFCTDYSTGANIVNATCKTEEVENLITSGSLLNLKLFTKIGEFDESLFIDSVDHDYYIRSRIQGYSLVKFVNISIHHNLGKEVFRASIKTLFLAKKKKIIHSPLRCYYMYRNMLYLEKKFRGSNVYLARNLRKIVTGNLKTCLFYGRNTAKLIRYLLLAKKDFKNNRLGKISETYTK